MGKRIGLESVHAADGNLDPSGEHESGAQILSEEDESMSQIMAKKSSNLTVDAVRPAVMMAKTYFQRREDYRKEAKFAVARYIVQKFLQEGDSILLDAGTSLYPIAEEIVAGARQSPEHSHFTIMTHNYKAFQILVDVPTDANLNIVLAGGRYDKDLNALFGPQTTMAYSEFFPKVVLIGISAMNATQGLFCHGNTEELDVKKLIFKKPCGKRIIVADYTKLGTYDSLCFGRSEDMLTNTESCIVIIDTPNSDASSRTKEKYQSEIERLHARGIDVEQIGINK